MNWPASLSANGIGVANRLSGGNPPGDPLANLDDGRLLQMYVQQRSQPAFAALVQRHVHFVYSIAARHVVDHHLAEDVTQAVFLILSQKASTMTERLFLPAWLFRVTRYAAANALKVRARRHFHERAAQRVAAASARAGAGGEDKPDWADVAPLLDGAVAALNETDRQAVLLRFYAQRSLREVGAALGMTEGTAQKRVDRALDKLRSILGRKGVAVGAPGLAPGLVPGLATLIATHSVSAAPAALAAQVTAGVQGAVLSAKTVAIAKGAVTMMTWAKMKIAALIVAAAVVTSGAGAAVIGQSLRASPGPPGAAPAPAASVTGGAPAAVTPGAVGVPFPAPLMATTQPSAGKPIVGFTITLNSVEEIGTYLTSVEELAALGFNSIQIVTPAYQRDVAADQIDLSDPEMARPEDVVTLLKKARALGMRASLMPIILLKEPRRNEWRGKIQPANWDKWWVSYLEFSSHFLKLANEGDATAFSVGSELITTETETARWETVIAQARAQFHGQLYYSTNWDHYEVPTFWGKLDMIGINGYWDLTKGSDVDNPGDGTLIANWVGIREEVLTYAAARGKPVLFTELGFPSLTWGVKAPWNYVVDATAQAAPDIQTAGYRSFVSVWGGLLGHPWPAVAAAPPTPRELFNAGPDVPALVAGIYFYAWEPGSTGGLDDMGYTVRGKPAYDLLKRWLASNPAAPAALEAPLARGPGAPAAAAPTLGAGRRMVFTAAPPTTRPADLQQDKQPDDPPTNVPPDRPMFIAPGPR